jgi:hypothetical protein
MKNQNIPFKIGHIPIKVKNLQSGIEDFERLGFTLTLGSKFNSLIYFKDTSFLEVLCNDMGPFINPLLKVFLSILSLSRSKKNNEAMYKMMIWVAFDIKSLNRVPSFALSPNSG